MTPHTQSFVLPADVFWRFHSACVEARLAESEAQRAAQVAREAVANQGKALALLGESCGFHPAVQTFQLDRDTLSIIVPVVEPVTP